MITPETVQTVVAARGRDRESLMMVLRDLEILSGDNHLSPQTLALVAQEMNLPTSTVAGFVGFYSLFSTRPRARYVLRVCKSGPCHVMGASTVFDAIEKHLGIRPGQATPDGLFFLEACQCLGVCSVAPAMMINNDLHGHLTEQKIADLVAAYRQKTPSASEQSGPEVEGRACVVPVGGQPLCLLKHTGRVDPTSIESYIAVGGYQALRDALRDRSPEQILQTVKDSGLRGRGGAGFPTGLKWSFIPQGNMPKYVVCNADEGEPGTFKDRILMEENPHLILEGMLLCGYAIGAAAGYIYVRGEFRRAIERLQTAIVAARERGFLGARVDGSRFAFDIFLREGGGAYVCGEESALINSMEGRRGYPRFRPPFPARSGFRSSPTTVNNVETLASVPMIVHHGADWYKTIGTTDCPGTKLYCLSGPLNRTGLLELPMGTPLRMIIDVYGGGIRGGKAFKFAQVGGTAGGILTADLLDLPLDVDQTLRAGVTLGSGAILVCDESVCAVDFLLNVLAFFEHESCGQCTPCRIGSSQLHHMARRLAERRASLGDLDRMVERARLMKKASFCALGQSPLLPMTTLLKAFRSEFERHCDPSFACSACDRTLQRYYAARPK